MCKLRSELYLESAAVIGGKVQNPCSTSLTPSSGRVE